MAKRSLARIRVILIIVAFSVMTYACDLFKPAIPLSTPNVLPTPDSEKNSPTMSEIKPSETPVSSHEPSVGEVMESTFYSKTLGENVQYLVYLPFGYQRSNLRYPVLYLLHGRGDSMHSWLAIQADLDNMIETGKIQPLIAVIPDVPYSKRASYYVDSLYTGEPMIEGKPVESAIIQDLIPEIDKTYRTIKERTGRAIAGYSMGGFGALRYVLRYPDIFCGAILLSPAVYIPLPPRDSSLRLFGAFGRGDTVFVDEVYMEKNYPSLIPTFEEQKLPTYVFIAVGDDEWRNPIPEDYEHDLDFEAARLYNRLVRTKYMVAEFRVLDGGHDWNVWRPAFIEGLSFISRFLSAPLP